MEGDGFVERVVTEGWTLKAAAASAEVSVRCARKWVGRYRRGGEQGLHNRSSAPRRVWNRTPVERIEVIVAVRGGPQHHNRTATDKEGTRRKTVGWEYVHTAVAD